MGWCQALSLFSLPLSLQCLWGDLRSSPPAHTRQCGNLRELCLNTPALPWRALSLLPNVPQRIWCPFSPPSGIDMASLFSSAEIKKSAPCIQTPLSCSGVLAWLFPLLLFSRLVTSSTCELYQWEVLVLCTDFHKYLDGDIKELYFIWKKKCWCPGQMQRSVKGRGSWPSALSGWRCGSIQGLWPHKDWILRLDIFPRCPIPWSRVAGEWWTRVIPALAQPEVLGVEPGLGHSSSPVLCRSHSW